MTNPLRKYFELVNEAELLICANKLTSAAAHYEKAFTYKTQPYGRDIFNAWICAVKMNNTARFRRYSLLLLERDALPTAYKRMLWLADSSRSERFVSLWKTLKRETPSRIDTVYRNELEFLRFEDQRIRNWVKKNLGERYNVVGRDTLNHFDSVNVLRLAALIREKGFPTEQRVGYLLGHPANVPVYELVLLHDRSWNNRRTLDTLLYGEVLKGTFHPGVYAWLTGKSYNNTVRRDSISGYQANPYTNYGMGDPFLIIGGKLYCLRMDANMREVNAARASIFLDSYEEMMAKGAFQRVHKPFLLLAGIGYANFEGLEVTEIAGKYYTEAELRGFHTISKQKCRHGLWH